MTQDHNGVFACFSRTCGSSPVFDVTMLVEPH
jgi:hypothetical protein